MGRTSCTVAPRASVNCPSSRRRFSYRPRAGRSTRFLRLAMDGFGSWPPMQRRSSSSRQTDRIAQLRKEGLIHESDDGRRLTTPRRLLDQWIKGYETLVRPKLLIGRYRAQETDPEVLEHLIAEALDDKVTWAFGGGAAAHRL